MENDTCYKRDIVSSEPQIDELSIETGQSAEVIVNCLLSAEYHTSIFNQIRTFATVIEFTHLDIRHDGFFVDIFFQLLCILPDLDLLKVLSLSVMELNILSNGDMKSFYSILSTNNKITKVVFQKLTALVQVQFFICLCPRMKYFEIHPSTNIDPKSLVRLILVENLINVPHLCTLCFCISTANDKLIKELQEVMKFEKLPHDYQINRLCDKIYIQRK